MEVAGSLLVAGCYERFLFGIDSGPQDAPGLKKARRPTARADSSPLTAPWCRCSRWRHT
jgi:hypothetical protein